MILAEKFKDDFFEGYYGVRPCTGEILSGDTVVLTRQPTHILVGLIDGLGHGKKAAEVAKNLKAYLEEQPDIPLDTLVLNAHEAFKGSQGAVVALARIFHDGQAEFVGLGNIEARILNSQRNVILLSRDGALGIRTRKIELVRWHMEPHEILLLYSDGISSQILKNNTHALPFIRNANDLQAAIEKYGKAHDDASLLYLQKLTPPN